MWGCGVATHGVPDDCEVRERLDASSAAVPMQRPWVSVADGCTVGERQHGIAQRFKAIQHGIAQRFQLNHK